VFGRRTSSEPDGSVAESESSADLEGQQGKGRATPKRKEAEAARKKRLAPPKSRKEASAMRRERMREARVKQRQALTGSGENKYLPARDQGPVKKYIRDYVDARRTIGEFLVPIFIVVLVVGITMQNLFPTSTVAASGAWVVVVLALILDSIRIVRGVKAGIRERFGADETRGITWYTLMRSWQMRRLRLPKPQVQHGAEV
jgi:hypothetical protein